MKEQLISFETAKLAKEKGVDGLWCNDMYCVGFDTLPENKEIIECDYRNSVEGQFHLSLAPTQSLLQKWLREKHNIYIWINPMYVCKPNFHYRYNVEFADLYKHVEKMFNTYEQALEEGLQEALKLIK